MYQMISAKLARQASDRFQGETGFLVLDSRANVIYRMKNKIEAQQACDRLNRASK